MFNAFSVYEYIFLNLFIFPCLFVCPFPALGPLLSLAPFNQSFVIHCTMIIMCVFKKAVWTLCAWLDCSWVQIVLVISITFSFSPLLCTFPFLFLWVMVPFLGYNDPDTATCFTYPIQKAYLILSLCQKWRKESIGRLVFSNKSWELRILSVKCACICWWL